MVIEGMKRESQMHDASSEGGINIRLDCVAIHPQWFSVDAWKSGLESRATRIEIYADTGNLEETSADLEDVDWRRIKSEVDAPLTINRASDPALSISNLRKPLRVIDIYKNCVVYLPQSRDYVTLSYVWGSSGVVTSRNSLEATSENIQELEVPGNNLFTAIPTTVKDAMTVCRKVNKQFLWVDRLCILQDQASDEAIRDMGMIYANSVLTIIAVDNEDAFEGLPGISRPILLPLETKIPGWCFRQHVEKESSHGSKWSTRGWTYQEEVFSLRNLYFRKYGPFFGKDRRKLDENIFSEIESYSHRELTYSKDKLRAIEGMLTVNCQEGHYFGLPLENFEYALLWTPNSNIDSEDFSNSLPSWLWCSVRSIEYDRHAHKYLGVHVASWALPGTGAGGHGDVHILEHTCKLTSNYWPRDLSSTTSLSIRGNDAYERRGRVLQASIVLAWKLGFFDAPMPTEFNSLMSWDQCTLLVYSKWRGYQKFWKASRNKDLRRIFEQEHSRRRLEGSSEQSQGSLLVYTQVSSLQLDTTETSPGRGPFALLSKGNILLGWVIFDRKQDAHAYQQVGETGVETITLSITQATDEDMAHYRKVARNPFSNETTEPDINAYDYQGNLIGGGISGYGRPPVILLNIMVVEELGNGHRRLGLGKGILQRWKEAESQFGVRVLD
jgi:hypothetical protein